MKCQKLLSTVTVSFRAKWWGVVAIEVAPDGKFDISRFFAINVSIVSEKLVYNKSHINVKNIAFKKES